MRGLFLRRFSAPAAIFLGGLMLSLPLCMGTASWLAGRWAQSARGAELDDAERQLNGRRAWAEQELAVFQATRHALPALVAQDQRLRQRVRSAAGPNSDPSAQAYLARVASLGRAQALWLLDAQGRPLERSPDAPPEPGLDPLQRRLLYEGAPAQQLLLPTAAGGAGLLHGVALLDAHGQPQGAVVARVGLDLLAKRMALRLGFVTDSAGYVLLASDRAWLGQGLPKAALWSLPAAERERRYGAATLKLLAIATESLDGRALLRIQAGAPVLERRLELGQEGLTLHLLQPLPRLALIAAAERQRFWAWLGASMMLSALLLAGGLYWWRGRQHASQMRAKNAALACLNEQLLQQTLTDPLTGCANRRRLLQLLDSELQRARRYPTRAPLALAVLDLDHFKRVNDRYGHGVGDRALRHVAQVLGAEVRASDLLARVGGEEFVLVMLDTPLAAAQGLLERLRQRLEETPLALSDTDALRLTASVGVSALVMGDSADALLARADLGLYAAKRGGRNRVCVQAAPLRPAAELVGVWPSPAVSRAATPLAPGSSA